MGEKTSDREKQKNLLGGALRRFAHLQTIGRTVEQRQHAFVHQIAGHGVVGEPNEGQMHRALLGNVFEQPVLLQAIGFAYLAFGAIAVDGMLEMTLRDRNQDLGVRTAAAVGHNEHEQTQREGDDGFLPRRKQLIDVAFQTEVFGFSKGVATREVGSRHGGGMTGGEKQKSKPPTCALCRAGRVASERRWLFERRSGR